MVDFARMGNTNVIISRKGVSRVRNKNTYFSFHFPSWFELRQLFAGVFNGPGGSHQFVFSDKSRILRVDPIVILELFGGRRQLGDALGNFAGNIADLGLGIGVRFVQAVHHQLQKFAVLHGHLPSRIQSFGAYLSFVRSVSRVLYSRVESKIRKHSKEKLLKNE